MENGAASKWEREFKKALEEVGDGKSWQLLGKGERTIVRENLGKGTKIMWDQGLHAREQGKMNK